MEESHDCDRKATDIVGVASSNALVFELQGCKPGSAVLGVLIIRNFIPDARIS